MALRLLLASAAVGLWVMAGLGQSVLMNQCYESRHADDNEPMVLPGLGGHLVMVVIWPMVALGNVLDPPDCNPIPVTGQ